MPSTDLAITFFTILTLLANLATVVVAAVALAARLAGATNGQIQRTWLALRDELSGGGLAVAWLVAAVATSGSLYFSEVAGFVPCRLCWIQRAAMYPLVIVLAGAVLPALSDRWRRACRWLGVSLAVGGAVVATYHYLLERFPTLESSGTCDPSVPCSLVWFERLGFMTLPYMALSGFLLIIALLLATPFSPAVLSEEASS